MIGYNSLTLIILEKSNFLELIARILVTKKEDIIRSLELNT